MFITLQLRRRRRDGGAVAVEAALITPVLMLILVGILEFGFLLKDWMSATASVRVAARTASAEPRVATFANDTARQMSTSTGALNPGDIRKMWVYKADSAGNPVGGTSAFTSCSTCVKYSYDVATRSFTKVADNWPHTAQNACMGAQGPPDAIGVYIEVEHRSFTNMFFTSFTIKEHAVMALEPIPSQNGCR